MRIPHLIIIFATVLLVSGCASPTSAGDNWEYQVVGAAAQNKEQITNQLAKEGWQLVDTDPLKGYLFRRAKP